MAQQLVSAIGVMVAGVFACAAYYWLSDKALQAIFPVRSGDVIHASRNLNRRAAVRPWLFIGPALIILLVYLVYPVIATLILSFYDRTGSEFVGLANYRRHDRPYLVGQYRQIHRLHADGDLLRRCLRHLEVHL